MPAEGQRVPSGVLVCPKDRLVFSYEGSRFDLVDPAYENEIRTLHTEFQTWWRNARFVHREERPRIRAAGAAEAGLGRGRLCCDAGAGDGELAELLAAQGWNCFALDLDPPASSGGKVDGPGGTATTWVRGRLEQPPFRPETLDLVVMCGSIQYTADPMDTLARWSRVLRPGGRVLLLLMPLHHTPRARERDQAEARRRLHANGEAGLLARRYRHIVQSEFEDAARSCGLDVRYSPQPISRGLRLRRAIKSVVVGGDLARFPLIVLNKGGALAAEPGTAP
jgi:ubiquinone/menaquinone biosynthesis C-methylase UbiE